jgi:hypothetical protein
MPIKQEFTVIRARWKPLSFYHRSEHIVILILSALIAIVVLAVWNLMLKVLSSGFDPIDCTVFQTFFGLVFTVIISLEFKRSLLSPSENVHCAGSHGGPHRAPGDREQIDDHLSYCHRSTTSICSRSGDPSARGCVLAGPRPGQAWEGLAMPA